MPTSLPVFSPPVFPLMLLLPPVRLPSSEYVWLSASSFFSNPSLTSFASELMQCCLSHSYQTYCKRDWAGLAWSFCSYACASSVFVASCLCTWKYSFCVYVSAGAELNSQFAAHSSLRNQRYLLKSSKLLRKQASHEKDVFSLLNT